jgi:hypothetical protein
MARTPHPHFVGNADLITSYHISCAGREALENIIFDFTNPNRMHQIPVFPKGFRARESDAWHTLPSTACAAQFMS